MIGPHSRTSLVRPSVWKNGWLAAPPPGTSDAFALIVGKAAVLRRSDVGDVHGRCRMAACRSTAAFHDWMRLRETSAIGERIRYEFGSGMRPDDSSGSNDVGNALLERRGPAVRIDRVKSRGERQRIEAPQRPRERQRVVGDAVPRAEHRLSLRR